MATVSKYYAVSDKEVPARCAKGNDEWSLVWTGIVRTLVLTLTRAWSRNLLSEQVLASLGPLGILCLNLSLDLWPIAGHVWGRNRFHRMEEFNLSHLKWFKQTIVRGKILFLQWLVDELFFALSLGSGNRKFATIFSMESTTSFQLQGLISDVSKKNPRGKKSDGIKNAREASSFSQQSHFPTRERFVLLFIVGKDH